MDRARPCSVYPVAFLLSILLIISTSALGHVALAALAMSPNCETNTERWVRSQLRAGEEADLLKREEKEDPASRMLSASCLEDLLSNRPHTETDYPRGVRIKGAIVTGEIDLQTMVIPYHTELVDIEFNGDAVFSSSIFRRGLSLRRSTFKKIANFGGISVEGSVNLNDTLFEGPFVLREASLAGTLRAVKARFTTRTEDLPKYRKYSPPFEFAADFNSMKVGRHAFFYESEFAGPVDFRVADIAGQIEFTRGEKSSYFEGKAIFNGIKVGGNTNFERVVFEGSASFQGADFGGRLMASHAQFKNAASTNFNSMRVGGRAAFNAAVFEGPVDFSAAEIAGDLDAGSVREDPVCNGKADGRLGAQFKNTTNQPNRFDNIKVGGDALFCQASFATSTSIVGAELNSLRIVNLEAARSLLPKIDLSRTVVAGLLELKGLSMPEVRASWLQVAGRATLDGLDLKQADARVNLEDARFESLNLTILGWPTKSDQINLARVTYQDITVEVKSGQTGDEVLELVDRVRHDPSIYEGLEAFYRRQGEGGRADNVYLARKRRERDEDLWDAARLLKWKWL